MRRKIWIACMIIFLAVLLTGCFGGESSSGLLDRNEQPNLHEREQVTLKVYANRFFWEHFMEIYGRQLKKI